MRPLELKLRGFKSYFGEGAEFDFRHRRLVGIVGPIGSGKSTILDAIAYALYGRTSTVAANTKSLIHQRASDATVSLRFSVEGQIWEAVRMLRRKGAGQHALYRYAQDGDDEPVEKVLLEGEVNTRVAELLGLEFDAFGRSVLLAQGRFAEFLQSRPSERDKVLKGVFGHDRIDAMRQAARERAGVAALDIEKLTLRVERLERLRDEIEELRAKLHDAEERVRLMKKIEPELRVLDDGFAAATKRVAEAEARLADLAELEARFPAQDQAERVVADAVEAGAVRVARAEALEQSRTRLAEAERRVAELRERGEPELIERGSVLVAKREPLQSAVTEAVRRRERLVARLDKKRREAQRAAARVEAATATATGAEDKAEQARRKLRAAAEALHEAQHADMAAVLRDGLTVGEPCPVCTQTVETVPPTSGRSDLEAATAAYAAAAAASDEAQHARSAAAEQRAVAVEAHESAAAALEGLEDETEAASKEVARAEQTVAEIDAELERLLGEGDPAGLLASRREAFEKAAATAAEAREAADRARSDHDQSIRDEQEAEKALSALRIDIADLAARVGASLDDSDDSPKGVGARLDALREAWAEARKTASAERDAADRERNDITAKRGTLLSEAGITGEDFSGSLGEASSRAAVLGDEISRREEELKDGGGLASRLESAADAKATFDRVAADLTDARFVRFLLDEERTRLAALGSEHFLRLSSGRYLFSDDGRFDIVDQTSADAVRKAESLSGGETFLASLALALALAEMVTRTGGRLDAFFLDEGFGSLDPEHLDLAMEGIEALVAGDGDRLVVVVSHVPEMRERIDDLIELDRDPATGDTRVLQG